MRRLMFPALGALEMAAAAALVVLGASLPAPEEVRQSFDGARRVTDAAGGQVRALRGQADALRRSGLRETADRFGASALAAAGVMKAQRIDFEKVHALRDAMGRAADGLGTLSGVLDPEGLGRLGAGLGEAADFLDRDVIPTTRRTADDLEAASKPLQATARRLAAAAREAPLNLGPVRELHDSLARFDEGMAAVGAMLDPRRLAPLRRATEGAEGAVSEAARMAERAAGYSYPVVEVDGLRPRLKTRPFWPRGAEVGADLKKVAAGVSAMGVEVDALSRELPGIQAAVAESRKALGATRRGLAAALTHQAEVDRLLKEMPGQADRLASALPVLTGDLSKALRSTSRLGEVAASLRKARAGVDASGALWPDLRRGLVGSASLLRAARDQLDAVLTRREEYEAAAGQVDALSAALAALGPRAADGIAGRLDEEDKVMAELAGGIEQVGAALPVYSRALSRCLRVGRLLAWLVAAVAGLHGAFVALGGRPAAVAPARAAAG